MNSNIIEFPLKPYTFTKQPLIAATMTRVVNGKTVIMNIAKMSKEEFVSALMGDVAMREKQDLARKWINS